MKDKMIKFEKEAIEQIRKGNNDVEDILDNILEEEE